MSAKHGHATLWTMLLALPLMIAIQMVSAKIGRMTGKGLADNMRSHYPAWPVHGIVGMLFIANVINLCADIAAMGSALQLLVGDPTMVYALGFALVSMSYNLQFLYAVDLERYVEASRQPAILGYRLTFSEADVQKTVIGYERARKQ